MKFNRRHILLAGLGAGVTGRITQEYLRIRSVLKQQELKSLANETLADDISIIDAAYASEANWDNEVEKEKNCWHQIF